MYVRYQISQPLDSFVTWASWCGGYNSAGSALLRRSDVRKLPTEIERRLSLRSVGSVCPLVRACVSRNRFFSENLPPCRGTCSCGTSQATNVLARPGCKNRPPPYRTQRNTGLSHDGAQLSAEKAIREID